MSTKEIIEEAVSLPVEERAIIVDSLLRSLNAPDDAVDREWAAVAQRRLRELRSGEVRAVPGDEVFERIWEALRMMPYGFHHEAESEFDDAIDYYESCREGLGFDFASEVHAAIRAIREHPGAWPVVDGDVRRCLTRRFPYGVLYSIEEDTINILAVMHLHRNPGYWRRRA